MKEAGYTKVILRPLMVVAGDHANNDSLLEIESLGRSRRDSLLRIGSLGRSRRDKLLGPLGLADPRAGCTLFIQSSSGAL